MYAKWIGVRSLGSHQTPMIVSCCLKTVVISFLEKSLVMFVSHPTQYDDPPSRWASIYIFMGMAPNLTWHSGGPRKQVATSYCWMVVPLFIVSRSLRVKTEDYQKKSPLMLAMALHMPWVRLGHCLAIDNLM